MKKILLLIPILFLKYSIYSQDYIKSDSLKIDGEIYEMQHLSFGNSSSLKLFKVITCGSSNSEKVKKEIITCNQKSKLEFTEFYVISIPNYEKITSEKEKIILVGFLEKIDTERMKSKLSTALVKSKFKLEDFTYTYFLDQPKNSLNDFKYYKLKITPKEVCEFIKK